MPRVVEVPAAEAESGTSGSNESMQQVNAQQPWTSFPSVLQFLHQEWRRYEKDRSDWDLERAELQAGRFSCAQFKLFESQSSKSRLAQLEGERRGQELLKQDLIRRIRMLEYALRQERQTHLKSSSPAAGPTVPVVSIAEETSDSILQAPVSSGVKTASSGESAAKKSESFELSAGGTLPKNRFTTSKTRDILKKYLMEVGYDEQSWNQEGGGIYRTMPVVSRRAPISEILLKQDKSSIPNGDYSEKKTDGPKAPVKPPKVLVRQPMTEEKQARRRQITESVIYDPEDVPLDSKSTETTEKELDDLEASLANSFNLPKSKAAKMMNNWNTVHQKSDKSPVKQMTREDVPFSDLDQELADLTLESPVNSEEVRHEAKDEPATAKSHLWKPKLTLKSHLDSVRTVAFHPNDCCLISGSDDSTIKFWNLETHVASKKLVTDIEPVITFRGHEGSVNALAWSTLIPPDADSELENLLQHGVVYSAGYDGSIYMWGLPEKTRQPYLSYDYHNFLVAKFAGHDDSIWDLKLHPLKPLLASVGADQAVKFWNLNGMTRGNNKQLIFDDCLSSSFKLEGSAVPTSVDFVHSNLTQCLVSTSSSDVFVVDIESGKSIGQLEGANETYNQTPTTQINRVITHSSMPIAITAHEDRYIRFFDVRSQKRTHSMVAHLDSVTTLDISPNGLVCVSSGHDASVRLWEISSYACLQEFPSHRKKFDEATYNATFHPRLSVPVGGSPPQGGSSWLATSGADACIKIFTA